MSSSASGSGAAAIKVTPKKLELLEADRFDALPDATFTRALAQTVCRALKIDPAPILKLLPPPLGHRLEHVGNGLNAPFRERPGLAGPARRLERHVEPGVLGQRVVADRCGRYLLRARGVFRHVLLARQGSSVGGRDERHARRRRGRVSSCVGRCRRASTQLAAIPPSADVLPVPAESPLSTPIGAMPASGAAAVGRQDESRRRRRRQPAA